MVDVISAIQMLFGVILFFAAGYTLTLVLFKKDELDDLERAVYSVVLTLTIPPLVIFFLNFIFKIPINVPSVYIVYILITAGAYALSSGKMPKFKR